MSIIIKHTNRETAQTEAAPPKPIASPALATDQNIWQTRRNRASFLAEKYSFAAELLSFYKQLTEVQEQIWARVKRDKPDPPGIARWAVGAEIMQPVLEITQHYAPTLLAQAAGVMAEIPAASLTPIFEAYLADIGMPEIDGCSLEATNFLARASLSPALEALDLESRVTSELSGEEKRCPWCWGLPQLKTLREDGEYSAITELVCGRCARSWRYPRRSCANCGEKQLNQLAVFEADELLPHLRVDACRTCEKYMVTVDLRRDAQAVPLVDELCALPLDLWATEQGFSKALPNLMGV